MLKKFSSKKPFLTWHLEFYRFSLDRTEWLVLAPAPPTSCQSLALGVAFANKLPVRSCPPRRLLLPLGRVDRESPPGYCAPR